MANNYTTVPSTVHDGVFLIYSNGYFRRYDKAIKASDKDGVKYIGIIYDRKAFAVALHDLGTYPIIRGGTETCTGLDFVEHTQVVQNAGANIPLPTGEYIPTSAMIGLLKYFAASSWYKLNDALDFVGGTKIDLQLGIGFGVYTYWIVDEYYATYRRGESGLDIRAFTGSMGMASYGVVRPVTKFIYNWDYLLGSSEPVDSNVVLSFSTMAKKDAFCDLLGADATNGDSVLQLIR